MDFNSGSPMAPANRATSEQQVVSDSRTPAKRISIISYQRSQSEERSKDLRRKPSTKRRKKRKMANVLKEKTEVKTTIKSGWDKKPVKPVIEESSPTSSKKSDSPWSSEQQPNSNDDQQPPKQSGSKKGLVERMRRSYSVKIEDELLERSSMGPLNNGPETAEDRLAREQWEREEAERKAAEMQARREAEMQARREVEMQARREAEMQARREAEQKNQGGTSTPLSEENNSIMNREATTESKHNTENNDEKAVIVIKIDEKEDLKHIEGEQKETKSEELKNQETSTRRIFNTGGNHLKIGSASRPVVLTEDGKIKLPEIITIRASSSSVDVESNEELERELHELHMLHAEKSDVSELVKRLAPVMAVVLSGAILLYFILSYG